MNISDLKDYKIVSAPAQPQGGITNISQLGSNYQTQQPSPTMGQPTSQLPLLSNPNGGLGTALKDVGIGAGKSFIRGTRDVAGAIQGLGKTALGVFGVDTSNMGIKSVDNSTQSGGQVNALLQPKSTGEKVGGYLETAGELGAGFAKSAPTIKTAYDSFKEARGAKLVETEFKDALDVVRPKLTKTLEAQAKAAGRGETKGIFKTTEIAPTPREIEMAQHAHEAGVSAGNTFDKNIQLMKEAQKVSANTLRSGLENAGGSWTRNDVVGSLNKIKTPLTIKSDTTLTKLANNFKKAIVDIASGTEKKPVGLLDLRQSVDSLIEKEFPSNIYHKDTPVGQYVRQIRTALNEMAESKLPEGKLPNGDSFKEELRKQHLLYEAIDNVARKAPKEGETARPIFQKAKALVKKHPIITGAAGYETAKHLGVPLP